MWNSWLTFFSLLNRCCSAVISFTLFMKRSIILAFVPWYISAPTHYHPPLVAIKILFLPLSLSNVIWCTNMMYLNIAYVSCASDLWIFLDLWIYHFYHIWKSLVIIYSNNFLSLFLPSSETPIPYLLTAWSISTAHRYTFFSSLWSFLGSFCYMPPSSLILSSIFSKSQKDTFCVVFISKISLWVFF